MDLRSQGIAERGSANKIHSNPALNRTPSALALQDAKEVMRAHRPNSAARICGPALVWSVAQHSMPSMRAPPRSRWRVASGTAGTAEASEELGGNTTQRRLARQAEAQAAVPAVQHEGVDVQQQTRKCTPLLKPIPAAKLTA